jgi:hypothetical protein
MSLELATVIHFLWLKHTPNQIILYEDEEGHGEVVISLRAIEKWTTTSDDGRTTFADLPTSARPHDTGNVHTVRALIKGEGYLSQKKIAQMPGLHDETVTHVLRDDFNMHKESFK